MRPKSVLLLINIIVLSFSNCFAKSYTNPEDSLGLVKLFKVLDGENWRIKVGWDGTLPVNKWFGISVDTIRNGSDEVYYVSKISLQSNKLTGKLPDLSFSKLEVLNLAGNKISGEIPKIDLPQLKILYLSGNKFSGKVPQINSNNIEVIDLSGNDLSGEIDSLICKKLKLLNLSNNNLTGKIPLLDCPLLESLYLKNNNFQSGLSNLKCSSIKIIDISNNKLEERISEFSFQKLQLLNLSRNRLELNSAKFNLPVVEKIDLSFNNISGSVGDFNCPQLRFLNLSNNYIYSFSLVGATNIQEIDLSFNKLVELGDLSKFTKMNKLDVSYNKLTFEDLEPNVSIPVFNFSKQDTLLPVSLYRNGDKFTLEVIAKGDSNIYQWELNGEKLEGANNKTFTGSDNGNYRCVINNKLVQGLTLYSKIINPKKVIYALKSDSLSLVAFYNATNGKNWRSSQNWLSENLILYWMGVDTDTIVIEKDSFLVVSAIKLGNNNLSGNLPRLSFKYLKELILYNNNLDGIIDEIDLPELRDLDLSGNHFEGNLPELNTPKLKTLDLSYNSFSGAIPSYDLSELEFIDLSNNELTGAIPNFKFPKLDQLILSENFLSGTIPKFEFSLLTDIDLSNNELTGGFPQLNSPNLFSIDISNNKIVDLPDLRYLKSLDFLVVSSNKLTFEDLEKNKVVKYFEYDDQDTILPVRTRYVNGQVVIKVIAAGNANKYQWQNYGNDLYGQNADSIIVAYNKGEFRCKVTNSIIDDISYYSVKINPELISVNDLDYNRGYLNISPNPANKYVILNYDMKDDEPKFIKIVDEIGNIYVIEPDFKNDIINLDLSYLPSGSYNLIIEGKHSIVSNRLVVLK